MTPKLHHIFPESCLLIVVGIIIGFLLFWTSKHEPPSTLTPDVFFLFMLPPIIFDAGYFMPNRLFFDHLGTILLMAVVGTIFNAMCIGAALYGCGVIFFWKIKQILQMFTDNFLLIFSFFFFLLGPWGLWNRPSWNSWNFPIFLADICRWPCCCSGSLWGNSCRRNLVYCCFRGITT